MRQGSVVVEFEGLAKRYDLRVVFRGVSGIATPGEVLVLAGPNGAGKSTLMAMLAGLLRPTRGEIRHLGTGGQAVPRERWRRHLGLVSPAISMYEELDGMENLRFFAAVRGLGAVEARCRGCLAEVGLEADRRTPVRGYSTGMAQRLKIAQAILHEPPLLMLDEPGSNLDPRGQDWLEGFVRDAAGAGRTVILATNDRRELEWGTNRVELAG